MSLTIEDIERRAKARGWVVDRHGPRQARVYSGGQYVASVAADAFGAWYCDDFEDHRDADYLETGWGTEAREGAGRVLSVVSQVAAMTAVERKLRMQIEGLYQLTNTFARRARGERQRADKQRREVLRLRHRLRRFSWLHEGSDRLRLWEFDALLFRANLPPAWRKRRTYHLARELRERRDHGAEECGWPRGVHGPKGRLP